MHCAACVKTWRRIFFFRGFSPLFRVTKVELKKKEVQEEQEQEQEHDDDDEEEEEEEEEEEIKDGNKRHAHVSQFRANEFGRCHRAFSSIKNQQKQKRIVSIRLQRTALLILALLENEGTTFHERLYATTNESDEKEPTIDKTRREYVDVFLKKIFLKAEESGCLRDDFAEKHGEKLLASASLETNESEDGKKDMTKKMFVYENATIQETGETFEELLNEEEEEEDTISPYENLSEITLSLSKNLFAGNTGAHEWTAGFKLAELAINEPGLVYNKTVLELGSGAGLAAVAMLRSQPLRMILTDKSRESNDNLERSVHENISKTTTTTIGNVTIQRENASDPLPPMPTGEDVYRKEALASKNRTEEEEMGFT